MKGATWTWIMALCVFTEILLLTTAQVEHMRNLAINKTCNTSSQYNEANKYSGNCSAAINGILDTNFRISSSPPNCIHTSASDNSTFWWVDLGQNTSVHGVTIYGRDNNLHRMQCVQVSLDGRGIYNFPTSGITNVTTDIYLHPPQQGRVVNITRNCTSLKDPVPFLNICEVQIWGCTNGLWGDDCQYECSRWCQGSEEDNYCDSDNGTCLKGCLLGYWGGNCTFTCGAGCNSSACNKSDGTCQCQPGWESPLCQNCSAGHYNVSNDCQNTCGKGCNNTCNRTDGTCQCQQGWQPPLCQNCTDGYYNVSNNCRDTCGDGCNNNTCSRTDGTCQCRPGWQPPLCQHCSDGHYNVSNDCQDICGEGCHDTCNSTDGTCQCHPGWKPPLCQECSIGRWGENCSSSCASGCQNGVCDVVNGTCQCKTGWATPDCDNCSDSYYSVSNDCQNTCGGGCNNTCNKTDGTCQCRRGWDPPLCQRTSTSELVKTNSPVGAIVGSVFAAAVAVVIVIVILYLRCRQQNKGCRLRLPTPLIKFSSKSRQQLSTDNAESETVSEKSVIVNARKGSKPTAPVKPQIKSKPMGKKVNTHVYSDMFDEQSGNGQPLYATASAYGLDPRDVNTSASETNEINLSNENSAKRNSKVYATVQKPVVQKKTAENIIYQNVELMENLDGKSKDSQSQTAIEMSVDGDTNGEDEKGEDIYKTENIYASYQSLELSSILDGFQKSLLASLASGKLTMEFSEFPKGKQNPHEVASNPENSQKNRFKALCAYDHSRVVLLRPKGDNNTDYINASYIQGCLRKKAYIATQGPRSHTVDDLWWMVWQEDVTQIIMLTSLIEGGKDKCEEYWPPVGTTKTYGHVTVTALTTDTRADFVVRSFTLETKKGGEERRVSQYHYLVWPDHGVPSTLSLVNFWRFVKARAQGAIPVVHCSAGVGRTGTYIALDIASDLRSRGRDVNVKEIVSRIRDDRILMVQTEAQYKFLHEAILEEHTSRTTRMTFDQFDFIFPDTINIHKESRVDKEFKMLCQMGEFVARPMYTVAASRENIHKNQCQEFLPDDDHLVYLTDYVPGRNQYINAVHMPSFRKRQGLILTQLPLQDTVVDMWRLIDGWDVNTIVSLGNKDQSTLVKNYCRYWPETDNNTLKAGQYTINLTSSSVLGDHLTCYSLSFTTKALKIKTVQVLHYDDWEELVPSRTSDILQLIDILESLHVEEDPSPVVVQCSDGMTRSGMFCALYDIINRAKHDQEIDVYLPVRQVRTIRQQAITSEVQYRYCYQAAQEYKRQYSVYQNT